MCRSAQFFSPRFSRGLIKNKKTQQCNLRQRVLIAVSCEFRNLPLFLHRIFRFIKQKTKNALYKRRIIIILSSSEALISRRAVLRPSNDINLLVQLSSYDDDAPLYLSLLCTARDKLIANNTQFIIWYYCTRRVVPKTILLRLTTSKYYVVFDTRPVLRKEQGRERSSRIWTVSSQFFYTIRVRLRFLYVFFFSIFKLTKHYTYFAYTYT